MNESEAKIIVMVTVVMKMIVMVSVRVNERVTYAVVFSEALPGCSDDLDKKSLQINKCWSQNYCIRCVRIILTLMNVIVERIRA